MFIIMRIDRNNKKGPFPGRLTKQLIIIIALVGTLSCHQEIEKKHNNVIALNSAKTYQTMTGWEAAAYAMDWPGHSSTFPIYIKDLANQAVNDIGINRVRLELYPGSENPVDYGAKFINGEISEKEYIHNPGYAYQIVNDNNDPETTNSNGFHFSFLDHKIDNIVIPFKEKLDAKGEKLYINLCYVDFKQSTFEHYNSPREYAEFIFVVFQHMQKKYGFVPDAVEAILEADLAQGWSPEQVGEALVATAQRLQANGFSPDFIAPSTMNMRKALKYFDKMIQVPGVLQYLSEFSYHRYSNVSLRRLRGIAKRAAKYDVNTSMLEWWNRKNNYYVLHEDLKIAKNSAWQQGVICTKSVQDTTDSLYKIDETNPDTPKVQINTRTKYNRQYYKFIRSGAVRIEATTNNDEFDPLAFINTDGKYVVVIKAETGGPFSIQGLPSGVYGIKYTTGDGSNTPTAYDVDLADQTLSAGQILNTDIPAAGVITIYAKSTTSSSK